MKTKLLIITLAVIIISNCTASINLFKPEINLLRNDIKIKHFKGSYDFGEVAINFDSPEIIFTIENKGNANLNLTGHPLKIVKNGGDVNDFLINQSQLELIVTPGMTTEFSIMFSPTTVGQKSTNIEIPNDDDNENPFIFTVLGTGIVAPEINVKQGTIDIPHNTGSFDFGEFVIDETSPMIIFTIENNGSDELLLLNSPVAEVSGQNNSEFIIDTTLTDNSILPGLMSTFTIRFIPTTVGVKTAEVSISNNDSDENPYLFHLMAVVKPKIQGDFNGDGFTDILIGAQKNAENGFWSGAVYIFFGSSMSVVNVQASNADVKIQGENLEGLFGYSVSTAGDVNGDGIDDLIVGAPNTDEDGVDSGSAYIFFGRTTWSPNFVATNADVKIIGESAGDRLGYHVSSAGDVNKDGFADVIIGALQDDDGGTNSGGAVIIFGKATLPQNIDAENADVKLIGEAAGNNFGLSVSKAGDINFDGYDDIVIGACYNNDAGLNAGAAYIFMGRDAWAARINASDADVEITGANIGDLFGYAVAPAGDINNDGFNDIVVTGLRDDGGGVNSGSVFIFFGRPTWDVMISANDADVKLIGEDGGDSFGFRIAGAGDVNKDGYKDILIGAYTDDDAGNYSGCSFVYFGRETWNQSYDATEADVKIIGEEAEDGFGFAVSSAGDFNKDGFSDFIVGQPWDDDNGSKSGSSLLFFGKNSWNSIIAGQENDVKFIGENIDDVFGAAISG